MTISFSVLLGIIVIGLVWQGYVRWWIALICVAAGAYGGLVARIASGLASVFTGAVSSGAGGLG